ncbi:MAG: GMC oxidoreductase [Candidatus Competibacteraceae bacterium]
MRIIPTTTRPITGISLSGSRLRVSRGNHFAGTHAMGVQPQNSVVDYRQRSWDHDNLYLVGAGSMPSIGSSNTTLTLSALSFLSAKHILDDLKAL